MQSEDIIYLNGIYATSTAIPYMENAPHNVIDGTDKAWITMNGAGPDEGLMMYFDNCDNIYTIEVEFIDDTKLSKINFMKVYINGNEYGYFNQKSKD